MKNYGARTAKIKRKYGADAFKRFGRLGGNPVLIAQREGRVTIHKRRVSTRKKRSR